MPNARVTPVFPRCHPGRAGGGLLCLLAALTVLAAAGPVRAYPTPAVVPYRWEVHFRPGDLRLYVDPLEGRPYWYFAYTVTNRTGADQIWAPTLVLFTDAGEILASGEGVSGRVEEGIRDLLRNPLLETQNEVIGDLLQGREFAKDGLAVWPARELDVNEISLFVGGLSGETASVRNPLTGENLILRKTLQRDYLIRGDALARGSAPIEFVRERGVLR